MWELLEPQRRGRQLPGRGPWVAGCVSCCSCLVKTRYGPHGIPGQCVGGALCDALLLLLLLLLLGT